MGRPPKGERPLTGAERQASYRKRQRERRAHDAIETQRHVRAIEVRLRDAEARPQREAEQTERLKKQLELANAEIAELKCKIAIMKNASAAARRRRAAEQSAKDAAMIDRTVPETVRKMLGMLGSEYAGERDAAALKLEAWRRSQGKSWNDLLG
jgi:hypothetical protein